MLEAGGISKIFPGVKALDNVSIKFNSSEIHALLGENGAGKSTFIKIISGVYKSDSGKIFLNNQAYSVNSPLEALQKGIDTVYQELQIIPQASVAENMMLNKLPKKGKTGFVDWNQINRVAKRYLETVGLNISPTTIMNRLTHAQKQLVEIAKALISESKVLLLDEPTASLTEREVEYLFKIMSQLKQKGVLIIFVTHILEEVFQICDRVSIFRDGRCVRTDDIRNLNRQEVVKLMIGREEDTEPLGTLEVDKNTKVLEVRHLTRKQKAYDISFELYQGEILGFYGLVGSGRTELARIIIGADRYDSGEILVKGQKAKVKSVYDALSKYNLGYITEDRREEGLILNDTVKINITITVWDRIVNGFGFIPRKKEEDIAWKEVNDLDIRITGLSQRAGTLSGGNQQKVNVAKWLAVECDILIFDEPTTGMDVGTKGYFTRLIWDLAKKKKSIILISSDMPEIIRLANRILVFSENRIVGEVDNSTMNYKEVSEKIGNYILAI